MVKGFFLRLTALVAVGALWAALVVIGADQGWLRTALADRDDAEGFAAAIDARLAERSQGNAVFLLLEKGQIVFASGRSIGTPVSEDSLFQVASLSKWVTAHGVMILVEEGLLDLDVPVSTYLTRWQLPESEFDNEGVTVRRLLSHTAGLTDGLGYGGFPPGEPLQSLEASLTLAADASPHADGATRVGVEPGSSWLYSGGGYTLLQLLIEEVSGQRFEDFMAARLFAPLGLEHTSFATESAEHPDVADFYDVDGSLATHYRFTAKAAAALYTSPADMARLMAIYVPGPDGQAVGRGVLKPQTLQSMRKPEASKFGLPLWGLGTILFAPLPDGEFLIGHDGNNAPAINTAARLNPVTGDGFVLFETGNTLLATELAGEWSFWQSGRTDIFTFQLNMGNMVKTVLTGWAVLGLVFVVSILMMIRRRRRG